MSPIRAMCRCGYPFDPLRSYDGLADWRHHKPRRYCSKRCARSWPAKDRAYERKQARGRALAAAWEKAGQLTLW